MTGPEVTQPDPDGGVEMTDGEWAAFRGVEVTAAMKAEDVPAEWVEKALLTQVKPGSTIPPVEAGSALNYIRDDLRRALAAVLPEIQAQALNGITEVFEIVDRHTNRRLEERVYLTSNEALNHVSTWDPIDQRIARVQSVARVVATTEEPTT